MTTESVKKMIALDPRAEEQTVDGVTMAPRLDTLDGKRIALLHDQRLNGDKLLFMVADLLKEQYEVGEVVYHAKPFVSDVSPSELLDGIAQKFDAAVIAIGD